MFRKSQSFPSTTYLTVALALLAATLLAATSLAAAPAAAESGSAFDSVMERYQPIHRALVDDSTAGIGRHAAAIERELIALSEDFSADRAGVAAADAERARQLLPELLIAAEQLTAAAGDLATARDAFYALSLPLVRYRELVVSEDRPAVAYCPMAKRSWLQPEGEEIANPYHGQSMLRCGEVVSQG